VPLGELCRGCWRRNGRECFDALSDLVDKRLQEAGYQILRRTMKADSQDSYTLKVTGLITDEAKFKAEYVECTDACFGPAGDMAEQ